MQGETATILVVDDEGDFLIYMNRVLEKQGFRVLLAPDGETALKIIATEKPDLVLTDLVMPKLNGYQLAKSIRESENSDLPIISLTGYPAWDKNSRAERSLVDLYLTKPVATMDLLTAVSICLERNKI